MNKYSAANMHRQTASKPNLDERKVRIKINMFGREIPAELGLHEVKLL